MPKLKFQHISIAKTQVSAYVHCQNTSFSIILNAESSDLAGIFSFPQHERKGLLNVCIFEISKIMPNLLFQHLYFDLSFVYCIEEICQNTTCGICLISVRIGLILIYNQVPTSISARSDVLAVDVQILVGTKACFGYQNCCFGMSVGIFEIRNCICGIANTCLCTPKQRFKRQP